MSEISEKQRIADMLIQSALRCAEFYDVLSSYSTNEQLKKLFLDLSHDGRHLSKHFQSWSEIIEHIHLRQFFNLNRSQYYYDSMLKKSLQTDSETREAILPELSNVVGAIQVAISFEKDSILFWEEIKLACHGQLSELLDELIKQKKDRVSMFLKMKGELV